MSEDEEANPADGEDPDDVFGHGFGLDDGSDVQPPVTCTDICVYEGEDLP